MYKMAGVGQTLCVKWMVEGCVYDGRWYIVYQMVGRGSNLPSDPHLNREKYTFLELFIIRLSYRKYL